MLRTKNLSCAFNSGVSCHADDYLRIHRLGSKHVRKYAGSVDFSHGNCMQKDAMSGLSPCLGDVLFRHLLFRYLLFRYLLFRHLGESPSKSRRPIRAQLPPLPHRNKPKRHSDYGKEKKGNIDHDGHRTQEYPTPLVSMQ